MTIETSNVSQRFAEFATADRHNELESVPMPIAFVALEAGFDREIGRSVRFSVILAEGQRKRAPCFFMPKADARRNRSASIVERRGARSGYSFVFMGRRRGDSGLAPTFATRPVPLQRCFRRRGLAGGLKITKNLEQFFGSKYRERWSDGWSVKDNGQPAMGFGRDLSKPSDWIGLLIALDQKMDMLKYPEWADRRRRGKESILRRHYLQPSSAIRSRSLFLTRARPGNG